MTTTTSPPSGRGKASTATPATTDTAAVADAKLTAFAGFQRVAVGSLAEVTAHLRAAPVPDSVLLRVFDDATGALVPLDLRALPAPQPGGLSSEPASAPAVARSVGRPKLGVVAREVTLLPRHWDWLSRQPGGASVALRRLVEAARAAHSGRDALRASREAAYRFMSEMAGDLPGFEEAARALFAGDESRFGTQIAPWPTDLRSHLQLLSAAAWKEQ
ncbi:MAG: DUF2239 family protein [Pseudomonadota bacterium]